MDSQLALTLHLFETRLLCPCGCGHPIRTAHVDLNEGDFEVDETVFCQAKAVLDRWEKQNPEREPGQLLGTKYLGGQ